MSADQPSSTYDHKSHRLKKFVSALNNHPGRACWIKFADFSWLTEHPEATMQIFNLLARVPAIIGLDLDAYTPLLYAGDCDRPRSKIAPNPSNLVCQLPFAQSLRRLSINDSKILISDIAQILTLPSLNYLSISQFNEHLSKKILVNKFRSPLACTLKELVILNSSPPTGPLAAYILSRHLGLEKLTWENITPFQYHQRQILPDSISKVLLPLSATLVELRIRSDIWRTYDDRYLGDFSQFRALKILNINDEVLFSRPIRGTMPRNMDLILHERLPSSLETLMIVFKLGIKPLIGELVKDEKDYLWLVSLSNRKIDSLPRLSYVKISQVMAVGRKEFEWVYPPDLALAFHASDIKLKITTLHDSNWDQALQRHGSVDA
ncbi:uncharacterized protein BP5553_06631 [Venustampulla echinocandica]|uniref:F-box domain-containing protein n=1 Tax=Venustampulla echinocandica TaxID=2656787 RepID=A0A370TKH0_9HELO|nr:uncharacterized protein BP5553_06631 [Venustampulla echinocandica]RDL36019.1 hypothetical protein BP5553_06631 [Venustampulla echinocandica]